MDYPTIPLITAKDQLLALVEHLRQAGRFAFDTEFVSEQTFDPVLCLVQVATDTKSALIDAMALRDLTSFWDVVNDPTIEVVMHAPGEDLRICHLHTGALPEWVFDVQTAAGLAGFSYPLSLGNLAGQTLGVTLMQGETRTDWRKRPLTPAQLRYAFDDVKYLLPMADWLRKRLTEMGRAHWIEEEMRDYLGQLQARQEEDRWRRLPSLHQLSRRGLEIARRLSEWREADAARSNRPLRSLLKDDLLVAIAKRQPRGRKDLEALRDFNRPGLIQRAGEILDLIQEAFHVPDELLPEHADRQDDPPGLAMVTNLLTASLAIRCQEDKVSPGLAGTAGDLKNLIRWVHQGQPEETRPRLARGWRHDFCGDLLGKVLRGELGLRIVDPTADPPIEWFPLAPPSVETP